MTITRGFPFGQKTAAGSIPVVLASDVSLPNTTIADGASTVDGATTDGAVTTDANGTHSGKLRGLIKILASVWDSANGLLKVSGTVQPGNTQNTTAWYMEQQFTGTNITTNTTTTLKSGSGVAHTIVINARGTGSTITVWDNTSAAGTKLATIDSTLSTTAFLYDMKFGTGLTVVTAGAGAADITVTYR